MNTPPELAEQLLMLFNAGHYAEVERLAQVLLAQFPNFGFAWKILGVTLKMQGKDALTALQRAVELLSDDPDAQYNLANALRELGDLESAVAYYRRALALDFEGAAAYCNLGNTLQQLGRFTEAESCFEKAMAIEPDNAELHYNRGNALLALGRRDEAIASFNRALALRPGYAEACNNLGSALHECGQFDAALKNLQLALQINPGYAEAHNNLGNVLHELMQLDAAIESFRRAIAIRPATAEFHVNLGRSLRALGRFTDAEACCLRALELKPDSVAALLFKAELHVDQGEFGEAEDTYRRAISIDAASPKAWSGIARIRKMAPSDDSWLREVQRLVEQGLPAHQEAYLRYALGKYFDDVCDFERAFNNYRRANELSKTYGATYDRQRQTGRVDVLRRTCDDDWMRRMQADGNPSTLPVLIVGMPRSGTSLAEQILAAHPAVHGAGELGFWNKAAARYWRAKQEGGEEEIGKLAKEYLSLLQSYSSAAMRIVDKMPGNFMHLGLIHATFPNVRMIHLQRNPIDTCLSIYFQNFGRGHTYANNLDDIAHYYTEYVRMMDHWRETLPRDAIMHVPYEGLVGDQEAWTRKMLDFIDVPWDARCIDFHQAMRPVSTLSNWQVRQKISTSSVERWRNYEKFVGPLLKLR